MSDNTAIAKRLRRWSVWAWLAWAVHAPAVAIAMTGHAVEEGVYRPLEVH